MRYVCDGMFIGTYASKVNQDPNPRSSVETIETFCSKELAHLLWIGQKKDNPRLEEYVWAFVFRFNHRDNLLADLAKMANKKR